MTHSKTELLDLWEHSVRSTANVLMALTPPHLAIPANAGGKVLSVERVLLHVTHHNAIHLGQIIFTAKLLRDGAICDLWKRTKALD